MGLRLEDDAGVRQGIDGGGWDLLRAVEGDIVPPEAAAAQRALSDPGRGQRGQAGAERCGWGTHSSTTTIMMWGASAAALRAATEAGQRNAAARSLASAAMFMLSLASWQATTGNAYRYEYEYYLVFEYSNSRSAGTM